MLPSMTRSTATYDGPGAGRSQVRRATLVAASLGFSVIQLDVFVVNVGIRAIGSELGGGTAALQWVVSAYTLMLAAFILTAGALADRFGARRMYCTGFVVFVAASLACGLAPTMGVLIAARAVQGVGAAILGACSLALLNHAFHDPAERTRAVGLWAAGASVALALGPVLGGLLIAGFGWRSIFFINLPIGAAGFWLTRRYAQETPPADRRLDLTGLVAIVAALGGLAFALIQGGANGFISLPVMTALVIAAMAAAIFVRTEATEREPMLPLALFRRLGLHRSCAARADGQCGVLRAGLPVQPAAAEGRRVLGAGDRAGVPAAGRVGVRRQSCVRPAQRTDREPGRDPDRAGRDVRRLPRPAVGLVRARRSASWCCSRWSWPAGSGCWFRR